MTRPPQRLGKQRSPSTDTAENGIAAASRDLKKKQGLELKESTVRGRKKTYCAELASQKEKGMIPSTREFKNAKNAKIANPRNIKPAKIKAHTVCIFLSLQMAALMTFFTKL